MFELHHQLFEHAAAMLVILKLVETGARRREQNGVARPGALHRDVDRALYRAGVHDGNRVAKFRSNFPRR